MSFPPTPLVLSYKGCGSLKLLLYLGKWGLPQAAAAVWGLPSQHLVECVESERLNRTLVKKEQATGLASALRSPECPSPERGAL